MDLAVKGLDELGRPFLSPDGLTSDLGGVVELGSGFALFANDDNPDTSAFDGTASKRSDTTVTTRSKVNSVSGSRRKVASLDPVDGLSEDLVTKRSSERDLGGSEVRTCLFNCKCVCDGMCTKMTYRPQCGK